MHEYQEVLQHQRLIRHFRVDVEGNRGQRLLSWQKHPQTVHFCTTFKSSALAALRQTDTVALVSGPPHDTRSPAAARERAPRLRVSAPVAFRRVSDEAWSRGSTVDISRSGVLFVPAQAPGPNPGDLLMVVFLSQVRLTSDAPAWRDLYCGGRVARTAETAAGEPLLAMQIEFEWAEKPPDPAWGQLFD
jgi:hypothetical protein